MVTYEDALKAREFWHMTLTNADGTAWRARRTGATKTWVTRPGEFKVPVKRGMNDSFYITPASAHVWCTPEKWPAEHVLFAGLDTTVSWPAKDVCREQLAQARRAYKQAPTPALAACIRLLEAQSA